MARITLKNLAHSYMAAPKSEDDYALKQLDHVWGDGEAYALLGASGCGKSTLLNIISGLLIPSQGRILFDDTDVTEAPTTARNIAQVFQFPVVYDTMTVRDNLAFPLRNRGADPAYIAERVAQIAAMIGMEAMLDRKARGLTADAKQKISLGRGMVREDVNALLFDEPLTVIDPHMKWELRTQLKELHHQFGHTMIYVTHDQTEALTFADKVVVMFDGRVVQIGTPQELFERPAHTFVGYFIGSPGMNVLDAEVAGNFARVGGAEVPLSAGYGTPRGRVQIGIRPEFVRLAQGGAGVPARILRVEDVGRHRIVRLEAAGAGGGVLGQRHRRRGCAPAFRHRPRHFRPRGRQRLCRRLARRTARRGRMKTVNQKAWFLVLPVLLLVAFSAVIPLMTVVNYSVQDTFGNNVFFWNGLGWFREMLGSERMWDALGRQLIFSVIILVIEIPLGVFVALNMPKKGFWASFCLVLMSLPLLIPWNVVGTIWQIFGRVDIGLLGHSLDALGIPYNYTQNAVAAWITVIVMDVWHWTSLVALLAYAGLQSIPDAYYQAAKIDQASRMSVFRYIELPKMAGVLIIAILLRFMDSFMIYTEPFVVTGGGPGNSTTFLSIDLVKMALGQFDLGPAAAFSLMYFLIILLISWVFYTVMTNLDKRDGSS